MRILLVGGGGREHALAWKLARDSARPVIYCAPGNAGTAALGENLNIKAEDIAGLKKWAARERPDLTVVGPEAPLCAGLVDELAGEELRVFGPCRAAAMLEGSKVFSKDVLQSAGVPTARSECFDDADKAFAALEKADAPVVIKADGLAAGKGVFVCGSRDEARKAVREVMVEKRFGQAGNRVLIEECLEGKEISMMALVDGEHAVLLPSAQDHKRVLDGDRGPNTGGMGAYSPAPAETAAFREQVLAEIIMPTVKELDARGIEYRGVLYAGLMITRKGPKVLEFNCRFGDPETQVVLPRLDGDLIPALESCIDGKLKDKHVRCRPEHCVCVVMTAGGYPGSYRKGDVITGLEEAGSVKDVSVFHAGTQMQNGRVVTAGGRVLGITALGGDTPAAVEKAYSALARVKFKDAHYRRDIAASVSSGKLERG